MPLLGDRDTLRANNPMPVGDMARATKIITISDSISFVSGEIGTKQQIVLSYNRILNSKGLCIGKNKDTSFAFTTGLVLTTQVGWLYKDNQRKDSDYERFKTLSNGQFMVNHEAGYLIGKNAIATSGSTDIVTYKIRVPLLPLGRQVDGRKVVTSAGTAEPLSATSVKFISLEIQALEVNTDLIAVGASTVVAASGTERGILLGQLATRYFQNGDLKDIYIDSRQDGEGVSYIYTY